MVACYSSTSATDAEERVPITVHLVFILQTFLAEVLPLIYHGRQVFWTGLNDIQTEGNFVWADGTPYQSSNFDGYGSETVSYTHLTLPTMAVV